MDIKQIDRLQHLIDESNYVVFFGGAGVSTESNIPDFRSDTGLYNQKFDIPPERILSHSFFMQHPDKYFDFHETRMTYLDAIPNAAHIKLAQMEQAGKLKAVITQNIDNLHQKAGSKNVIELHGSAFRNYCMKCRKYYDVDYIVSSKGVPRCECGGIVKPDVVLFEEALDQNTVEKAIAFLRQADLLIVGGTSLAVYPAAGLIEYTKAKIVLINKTATRFDNCAELVIYDSIGDTLSGIKI